MFKVNALRFNSFQQGVFSTCGYLAFKINNMKITPLIGMAKLFVKSKKIKLVLIGAQFGYMGYKYLKSRKRKRNSVKALKTAQ